MSDPLQGHWVTLPDGRHIFLKGAAKPRAAKGTDNPKAAAAKKSYNAMTKEKMMIALTLQDHISKLVGGEVIPDNKAFDVVVDDKWIEVKTVITAKNDKITVHPASKRRKLKIGGSKQRFIIVADIRGKGEPRYYLFRGIGSFRFGNLIPTPQNTIRNVFRGGF